METRREEEEEGEREKERGMVGRSSDKRRYKRTREGKRINELIISHGDAGAHG